MRPINKSEICSLHTVGSLDSRFGGPSRSVPYLVSALARITTCDIQLVCQSTSSESHFDSSITNAVPNITYLSGVYSDRFRFFFPTNASSKIASIILSRNINVVHDHGIWLPINNAAATAARRHGTPYVISPRGMLSAWPMQHKQVKKKLAMWLYQRRNLESASMFFATSTQEAGDIRNADLAKPIAVIPNGVHLPELNCRNDSMREAPERIALFISRIHPKKGLPDLIAAWLACAPRGWKLVIAGPSEEGHIEYVKKLVFDASLEDAISFAGAVEGKEKATLFANADLFVLPSHSENFGIVVAEALSYGVPVITTTATPWEELVSHKCGWWVGDNKAELCEALREATVLPKDQLIEMGDRGRRLVAERYSWPNAANKVHECYAWLLGAGPKPNCILDS